jgi:predicted RNA-binding protein with PUA-like domain
MVDVKLVRKFKRVITLDELRQHATGKLANMIVLKRGNRLSITPVTKSEWSFIESLARE